MLVAGQLGARDDERRGAAELLLLRALAGGDEPRERLGADHAEAPRLGQVMVRREARELEQLLDGLAVDRARGS